PAPPVSPIATRTMNRDRRRPVLVLLLCGLVCSGSGCGLRGRHDFKASLPDESYHAIASQIEYPTVAATAEADDAWASLAPMTLADSQPPEYWDLRLEE